MARNNKLPKTLPPVKKVPVEDLYLDPRNPRLAELGLSEGSGQDEIMEVLWQRMAVDEIAYSIAINGYFEHEPLFATNESGRLYVMEGNRRLAAVRLLLDGRLRRRLGATDLPNPSAAVLTSLRSLPVIECTRNDIWQYVGFKHVNGPQPWDSYSKAHYVARVHHEQGVTLERIAETIGDRHATVRRLYRGMMALRQAETAGVFSREDRWNPRFAFSHLYTGLDYPGFQQFLGFKAENSFRPNFVPKKGIGKLGELCEWLYGSKAARKRPLIRSQNPDLKNLDTVLQSRDGVAALRRGMELQTALDISRGDEELFREALVQAKFSLQTAKGKVLHGYNGEQGLLTTAEEVLDLAQSLSQEMRNIRSNKRVVASGRGS